MLEAASADEDDYDPRAQCMLGNFPQALTHMALINTAYLLRMPEHLVKRAARPGRAARRHSASGMKRPKTEGMKILVVDVGGSHVKCIASGRNADAIRGGYRMWERRDAA